ncbi:MAG: M15 family metallopeptidase [Verrucomicrobiales bacterium]|nr:M15 family metallopeptidase [Verrucomicrobiales bacterium]
MRALPRIIALTALLAFGIPLIPVPEAAGLFNFSKDPVIRKAKRYNLVPVTDAAPGVFVDMRYKFTSASGKPLYLKDMPCLINADSGKKLKVAQREVARQGYALKIWDAWRPPEAHKALWEAVKDPRYVVPPEKGLSWHCYGISIDLTLVKADGSPTKMPTKFDVFTKEAASNYTGNDPEIKKNLALLQNSMRKAGFSKINDEWWHFDDKPGAQRVFQVTAKDLGIEMPK